MIVKQGNLDRVIILHEGQATSTGAASYLYAARRSPVELSQQHAPELEQREFAVQQADDAVREAEAHLLAAERGGDEVVVADCQGTLATVISQAAVARQQYEDTLAAAEQEAARGRGCVIGGTALVDPVVRNAPYPNTVTAASQCIYVEFPLSELEEAMNDDSAIAAAVYHCFYRDRIKKIKSRGTRACEQSLQEYTTLIKAILADGLVHPQEREMVESWREEHKEITEQDHQEVLKCCGWTIDDWAKGGQFVIEEQLWPQASTENKDSTI